MEQKRYSPKLGIDVESIARMAASKNIKGARSINAPKFSTPQDIYRFGFDYNKFELAPKSREETATRPIFNLQYKKGKRASGINKQTQNVIDIAYNADIEKFKKEHEDNEWVRDTTKVWSWVPWLNGMTITTLPTSQFLPRIKEETNMQKNTIKQRIANNCYNTITARLLREQSPPPQSPPPQSPPPQSPPPRNPPQNPTQSASTVSSANNPTVPARASYFDDISSGAADVLRLGGVAKVALKKTALGRRLDAALTAGQWLGLLGDAGNVVRSHAYADTPQAPGFTTDTTGHAWTNLLASVAGLGGIGGIGSAISTIPKVGPVLASTVNKMDQLAPAITKQLTVKRLPGALAAQAVAELIKRPPGTIDPALIDPIRDSRDQFQIVRNAVDMLGWLPAAQSAQGSQATIRTTPPRQTITKPEEIKAMKDAKDAERKRRSDEAKKAAETVPAPAPSLQDKPRGDN